MNRCGRRTAKGLLAAGVLAGGMRHGAAHAQPGPPTTLKGPSLPGGLTPVDPVVEDVTPLSLSLRTLELGLQHPRAFDRIYRLQGLENRFVRVDGGLYAVFPQSAYAPSREGAVPLIPAGTEYHLGDPTGMMYRPSYGPLEAPNPTTAMPISLRIDHRLPSAGTAAARRGEGEAGTLRQHPPHMKTWVPQPEPVSSPPLQARETIFGDEAYRESRLQELLQRAARAEQSR